MTNPNIHITLNNESFRYDVHSLVMAFYPGALLNYEIISEEILGITPVIKFNGSVIDDKLNINLTILIPSELAKNRTETKNVFKRDLYNILSKETGMDLPWGTLTGIRPIKLPSKLIRDGKTKEEVLSYMEDTFYISNEKNKLAYDIAQREQGLLTKVGNLDKAVSLYIGIPFCPSICAYCSFSSYPIDRYIESVEAYIEALKLEIDIISKSLKKDISTVYIGGGTPSSLSPGQLSDLINYIKYRFNLSSSLEFTVECGRPDSITYEKLIAIKDCGIDRISINPQTMNNDTLKLIGRNHSAEDIERAFETARGIGFKVINCDLIVGLPGEGEKEVKYTLNKIKGLNPENLTVHSLAIKRASRLNQEWKEKDYGNVDADTMDIFFEAAKELSLSPYYLYRQKQISGNQENIGFAKNGLECLYNVLIMGEYHDIIALGAGGVSKFLAGEDLKANRVSNVKDVYEYIKRAGEMAERKLKWL